MTGTTRMASAAAFAAMAFTGCQSMPERPLDLAADYAALVQRGRDFEPVAAFAAELTASSGAAPVPFDPEDGVTLAEAETIALLYNGEIRLARIEADGVAAIAAASGRWDDPGLDVSGGRKRTEAAEGGGASLSREWSRAPEGLTRSTSYTLERARESIDRSWISAGSLSLTLPLSGRLGAERRARSADYDAAVGAVAETEWRVRIALRQTWRRWSAADTALSLIDDHLALLEGFARSAAAMAAAGELPPGTTRLLAVERGRMRAERAAAEADEQGLRIDALHLMGLAPDAPIRLMPDLDPGPAPDTAAVPALVAERHPAIARLRAQYAAAEARLRVELRKQYPDITLSPMVADEGDETAIALGLGMPIPVWNANRAGIAEAAAARDIERARVQWTYESLLTEYQKTERAAMGARARRETLTVEAAPEADRQLEEAMALLRAGEIDVLPLYEALAQAYAVKSDLLSARADEAAAQDALAALHAPAGATEIEP